MKMPESWIKKILDAVAGQRSGVVSAKNEIIDCVSAGIVDLETNSRAQEYLNGKIDHLDELHKAVEKYWRINYEVHVTGPMARKGGKPEEMTEAELDLLKEAYEKYIQL